MLRGPSWQNYGGFETVKVVTASANSRCVPPSLLPSRCGSWRVHLVCWALLLVSRCGWLLAGVKDKVFLSNWSIGSSNGCHSSFISTLPFKLVISAGTSMLNLRATNDSPFDLMSLGECMVRLSPPAHGRIEFTPLLEVHVGGGEYNVAYALARLGLRTAFLSRLVDNPIGKIVVNHGRAVGVDMSNVVMAKFDGVGKADRIGLNFTEVGTGVRASVTMYDRGHSATMNLKPGMIDFKKVFGTGVRWLHTGGVFTALSDGTAAVCKEALIAGQGCRHDHELRLELSEQIVVE